MPLTLGIAAGALAFFFADRGVERLGNRIGEQLGYRSLSAPLKQAFRSRPSSGLVWRRARASAWHCWRPSSCPTCPRR